MADSASFLQTLRKEFRPSRLGPLLGITPQAVSQWKEVPLDRVPEIEKVTGIPRAKLRPDIFGEAA